MNKIGLTTEQVIENRKRGTNELTQKETKGLWKLFLESLDDFFLKILMVVLLLQIVFYAIGLVWPELSYGHWSSAVAIFLVIFAVSFASTYMNYKQDKGAKALKKESNSIKVKVYRDGQLVEVSIDDIVLDDCVYLQSGDKVPADGILIDGSLTVDQSALNGESKEAKKVVLGDREIPGDEDTYTEFKCFRGSVVTSGSAILKVTAVGDATVLGTINESLQEEDDSLTPSEQKLEVLGKNIGIFGYFGGGASTIINLVLGFTTMSNPTVGAVIFLILSSIMLGASIVVMAVPEGLPVMNIIVQMLNVGKLLKAHVYVRNPKSIETTGYLDHVFTDKTGTLTEGKMRVVNVITGDAEIHEDYSSICDIIKNDITIGAGVNNDAIVSGDKKAIGSNDTDRALLTYLAIENGVSIDKNQVVASEPFDSKAKYSSITISNGTKYSKGAPDAIINECTAWIDSNGKIQNMDSKIMSKIKEAWKAQTTRAMRVIGIVKQCEGKRIFVALMSIRDDVRKDVKHSISRMHRAGVSVTMVTGDVLETATAIAKEAGLINAPTDICITHTELAKMSDQELSEILPRLKVVARAIPKDKERLIEVSRSVGKVVAMTGDGVNDAAALHKADVGFSMGSGTEVAKEASDIIILNDSLTSIADAIMYGRTMSKSIKKFIIFQLTVNVSTVFTAIIGLLFGWSEVFTIIQILWINMIMDTLAAFAYGQEPARESYMNEKPVSRFEKILNGYLKSAILVGGVFITIVCVGILKNIFGVQGVIDGTDELTIRTFMFSTFILSIIMNSLNTRTESLNLFEHILENKNFILVMSGVAFVQVLIIQFGGSVFGTVPLSLRNWGIAILISFMIIPIDLLRKVTVKKLGMIE